MRTPTSEHVVDTSGSLAEIERTHILSVLQRTRWVIEGQHRAAAFLGLHPNTLRSRLKQLGLTRPPHDLS
jgi:transcriptional regulator with GAF, ATPase, and Fis domain